MDDKIQELIALGGAECKLCGQRMRKVDGCTWEYIESEGQLYKRIRYGDEDFQWADERCHDCACLPGHYHHFNCDVEQCPICGGQLIGCDCDFAYSDGKDDADTTAIYNRTESCQQETTLEEQKKAAENLGRAFGYMRVATVDQIDSGLKTKEEEAVVIRYIFDTFDAYCKNPPEDLVQQVLQDHEGEDLTYDEAKALVPLGAIELRIADEVNAKWPDAGKWFVEARISQCAKKHHPLGDITPSEHTDIVSKEVFEQVQEKLRDQRDGV